MAERRSAADGYDVVGIGNAIVDIIARCDDAFLSKHDLAKGFMRLIPAGEAGRLYEAMGPAIERSGGSAANTIAGLASFGAKCGFIGRVAARPVRRHFPPRHPLARRRLRHAARRRRRADRALPHLRDAGRRAHHEHLPRRERELHARRRRCRR